MKPKIDFLGRPVRDGQRGQALVLVGFALTAILSVLALSIDLGGVYYSYQNLLSVTKSAAMAGGSAIPAGTAVSTAYAYSGDKNAPANATYNVGELDITNVTPTLGCVSTTTYPNLGLPPCIAYGTQASANAIQVTETAKVPMYFAKLFGVTSLTITATSTASAKGGGAGPYNILMVLDTTASMGNTTDPGCTVPGIKGAPTPEQCAQYGIQQLLGELDPCSTALSACPSATNGVISNPVDQVGLMVFPGLCSQALVSGNCPTSSATSPTNNQGTGYAGDYACPTTAPVTTPYNNNPAYSILPLQSDYRASDTTSSLNTSSDLVDSVGATIIGKCDGVQTPGGEGTFYAGVLAQAQAYLTTNSVANVQNVIIFLSDGDANASSTQMGGTVTKYSASAQCQQAVTVANTDKGTSNPDTAGLDTLIYSVSYGSETSGCSSGDTLTPCQTMEDIASAPSSQYFFSVPLSGKTGGTVCSGARSVTNLDQVFTDIAGDLTTSRLISNSDF